MISISSMIELMLERQVVILDESFNDHHWVSFQPEFLKFHVRIFLMACQSDIAFALLFVLHSIPKT